MRTVRCKRCGGRGTEVDPRWIGEDMRAAREKCGMTAREVADLMGVSAAYVCDLENGRRNWNFERMKAYRKALK